MPKRIYVGNLPFDATEVEVRKLVSAGGEVQSVSVKADKPNNRAIAQVDFAGDGPKSFDGIDGEALRGRKIVVSDDRKVVVNHEEQ